MKVSILTEISKKGLGHLSRMEALYQEFLEKDIETVEFFIEIKGKKTEKFLNSEKNKKIYYTEWINKYSFINQNKFDIAIVDSYSASKDFLRKLAKKSKLNASSEIKKPPVRLK